MAVNRFDWTIRVKKLNAFVFRSQFKVTLSNAVVEFQVFRLEAAFVFDSTVIARAGAGESDFRLDIEEKSQIRSIGLANQIGLFSSISSRKSDSPAPARAI